MNRPSPFLWLTIILILILPSAAGRFLLDLAGGLLLLLLLTPILIASIGWISWKLLQPKFNKCESCGTTFFNEINQCPLCGSSISDSENQTNNIPASNVIIDISAEETKET